MDGSKYLRCVELIDYIKGHRDELSPTVEVNDPLLKDSGVKLLMKRDDQIHPHVSGNKWRKLKYNLTEAVQQNHHTLLTFGGAYSNHIAATAFMCASAGLDSIGIIRGEDDPENPTLQFARKHSMELHFVSREDYRRKSEDDFILQLREKHGRFFLVPEGGANALGVRGCAQILPEVEPDFDVVCTAMGTGTTAAGLVLSLKDHQKLIGFPAVKGGEFLKEEVARLIEEARLKPVSKLSTLNSQLSTDYHFGGYAKVKPELLEFMEGFTERTGIPLDPVYTGKMMFGIYEMTNRGEFAKGTTILALHTGGLQGWDGMKQRGLV